MMGGIRETPVIREEPIRCYFCVNNPCWKLEKVVDDREKIMMLTCNGCKSRGVVLLTTMKKVI